MSKRVILLLLTIWLLGGSWWYTSNTTQTSVINNSAALQTEDLHLSISSLAALSSQSFNFRPNQFELSVPGDINTTLVDIAYLLQNSRETYLCITGRYSELEKNFSNYKNLGIARAEAIKKNLIFWGAPINKIDITAIESIAEAETMVEGINLHVDNPLAKSFSPLNLYFKANKYKIKVTRPIKDYVQNLKNYLDENPDKKVKIIGHSFEGDSDAWNERVSRYRATEVEKLFIKMGIDKDQIESNYMGKKELMIEDGDKEELSKNRRVEVRVI